MTGSRIWGGVWRKRGAKRPQALRLRKHGSHREIVSNSCIKCFSWKGHFSGVKNTDQFQRILLSSVSARPRGHSKGCKPSGLSGGREKAVAALCPLHCLYTLKHSSMIFVCLVMKYPIFSSAAGKGEAFFGASTVWPTQGFMISGETVASARIFPFSLSFFSNCFPLKFQS